MKAPNKQIFTDFFALRVLLSLSLDTSEGHCWMLLECWQKERALAMPASRVRTLSLAFNCSSVGNITLEDSESNRDF